MLDKVAILTNRNTSTWKKPNVQFIFHKGLKTLRETWLPSFFWNSILQIYTNDGCKDIKIKIYVYQPFSWDHKTHIYKHVAHSSSVVKIYCPKKYQIERFLLPTLILKLAHNRKAEISYRSVFRNFDILFFRFSFRLKRVNIIIIKYVWICNTKN